MDNRREKELHRGEMISVGTGAKFSRGVRECHGYERKDIWDLRKSHTSQGNSFIDQQLTEIDSQTNIKKEAITIYI